MDAKGARPSGVKNDRRTKYARERGDHPASDKSRDEVWTRLIRTNRAMSSNPPAGNGVSRRPNEVNHPNRGPIVTNTIAQKIHLVKLPPMRNVVPPSRSS